MLFIVSGCQQAFEQQTTGQGTQTQSIEETHSTEQKTQQDTQDNYIVKVDIAEYVASSKSLTPTECTEKGGRTVNVVNGSRCEKDEENIGEVRGLVSPNICCM